MDANVVESGIYKLEWDNGYFYIGQAINITKRFRIHKSKFKSKQMIIHQPKLFNIKKEDSNNFKK
jgi:hypothetical protein